MRQRRRAPGHRPDATLVWLAASTAGLLTGIGSAAAGAHHAADIAWSVTTLIGLIPAAVIVVRGVLRREAGVDVIAVLALAGALAVHELLAGAVIAVMLASGRALEQRAASRAGRDLQALLQRAPREARRYGADGLETLPLEAVRPGDVLLIRPGDVVPVDGRVERGLAVLDESALTGEPLPVNREIGEIVRSGVIDAGGPFDLRATSTAADSAYAGIVRLVREAQASSAPFVRLANRYAAIFLPVSLLLAAVAWAVSGEAVRAVAVLVVATPCPLLLAAPVAIVSGLSRAARRGVVVKGGGALERLARGRTLLLDKTGTVTAGRPTLARIVAPAGLPEPEVLRLAASLDQVSPHVVASAVVRAARARDMTLTLPSDVVEEHGSGVRGRVDGVDVAVGRAEWVTPAIPRWVRRVRRQAALDEALTVFVAVRGALVGALLFDDPVRPDAARTIRRLRAAGIQRAVLVTGDRAEIAETVGAAMGLDEVLAERTPAEKVAAVRLESERAPTIMVGDGINDAPALAAAGIGVALGARGSSASSEAADVVITVDRLDRLAEALRIAGRSRRIALQSVVIGMALSFAAMAAAAAGQLPPTAGALLQEGIDVAVILNALRALGTGPGREPHLVGQEAALGRALLAEHAALRASIEQVRTVADDLGGLPPREGLARAREVHRFLADDLLEHEEREERTFYPAVARALGGDDPTDTMERSHVEIAHLTRRIGRLLDELVPDPDGVDEDDLTELRRLFYGLYAVLRLHFAQEEEGYFTLAEDGTAATKAASPPPDAGEVPLSGRV